MQSAVRWSFVVAFLALLSQVAAADDVETLRKERDVLLQRVVEMADTINKLQAENAKLQESNDCLRALVANMAGRPRDKAAELPRQGEFELWLFTRLDGVVTSVGDGLFEVSLGSDDAVWEGMDLQVSRGKKVLGTATVRNVASNRSVVQMRGGVQDKVRKGDRVSYPDEMFDAQRVREREERRKEVKEQSKELLDDGSPLDQEFHPWLDTLVEGVVTAQREGLIEISVGSDDGIVEGMRIQLFRDKKILGWGTIRKVTANRSVAEVTKEVQAKVRKGDRIVNEAASKRLQQLEERRRQLQ